MNGRIKISLCRIRCSPNNSANVFINRELQVESTRATVPDCRIKAECMQNTEGVA